MHFQIHLKGERDFFSFLNLEDCRSIPDFIINRSDFLKCPYDRELAMAGAHVTMACRNTKSACEIARMWQQEAQDSRELLVEVSCALETRFSTFIASVR